MSWIYKQTETGQYPLWTVGTDDEDWQTDSDHDTRESAANRCAYLNGAPHDYIKLKEQNEKLKEGLEKIQNPVLYLQKQAEASGAKIDGLMAVALSKDCEWLKNIAYETLKSCES